MKTNDDGRRANGPTTLKQRIIGGGFWLFTGQFSIQLLRFGSNLILTRLLVPEAFGLMGVVQVFMMALELFSDVGLRQSVIHDRRGESAEFLNTVWTIQVIRGVLIWGVTCVIAYPVAIGFGMPKLAWLLPIVGISAVFRGLMSTSLLLASRRLDVRWYVSVELRAIIIGSLATIALAYVTRSVLALALGWVVNQIAVAWLSYQRQDVTWNQFHWDREIVRSIAHFGRWTIVSSALTVLRQRSDRLAMAKLVSEAELGAYMIGANLALMPMMMFGQINNSIMQPIYARLRGMAPSDARSKVRRLRMVIVGGSVPILSMLALGGDLIVRWLYPPELSAAGWYCSLIALAAMTRIATDPGPVFPARGDARTHFGISLARTLAVLIAMTGGYFIGASRGDAVTGLIMGVVLAPLLSYPYQAAKYRQVSVWLPEVDIIGLLPVAWILGFYCLNG